MGEFRLIARLGKTIPRSPSVVVGLGDDTAVLRTRDPKRYLLLKTDPVIEGTHFVLRARGGKTLPPATPRQIGWKAMARNLSDIAAMGGLPCWAVVSLGLPARTPVSVVDGIYRGLNAAAARFGVAIVGGDTSRTDGPLFVVVSLVGEVEKRLLKLRSAARPGQMVFVTGTLGGSLLGKHLEFSPRIKEAHWLVRNFPVQAMIDISDGLAGDLQRLAEASRVGFDVVAGAIPVSAAARRLAQRDGKSPLSHAWSDGEDYELLFTIDGKHADGLLRQWYRKFALLLSPIGVVTGATCRVRLIGAKQTETIGGYEHFARLQRR